MALYDYDIGLIGGGAAGLTVPARPSLGLRPFSLNGSRYLVGIVCILAVFPLRP
jgi:hypothetical protein